MAVKKRIAHGKHGRRKPANPANHTNEIPLEKTRIIRVDWRDSRVLGLELFSVSFECSMGLSRLI